MKFTDNLVPKLRLGTPYCEAPLRRKLVYSHAIGIEPPAKRSFAIVRFQAELRERVQWKSRRPEWNKIRTHIAYTK